MPVTFTCEVCNYSRALPDTYSGHKIRCPQCAAAVHLPSSAEAAGVGPESVNGEPAPAGAAADTRPCPFCAEPIKIEARKCRWCGEIVDRQLAIAKQKEKLAEVQRRREILMKEAPGAKGSLILGIIGLLLGPPFLMGFLLGPIAIAMACSARNHIKKEPRLEGAGMATGGLVLGILSIVATVIVLLTNLHLLSDRWAD